MGRTRKEEENKTAIALLVERDNCIRSPRFQEPLIRALMRDVRPAFFFTYPTYAWICIFHARRLSTN